jgi:hypothetical protein
MRTLALASFGGVFTLNIYVAVQHDATAGQIDVQLPEDSPTTQPTAKSLPQERDLNNFPQPESKETRPQLTRSARPANFSRDQRAVSQNSPSPAAQTRASASSGDITPPNPGLPQPSQAISTVDEPVVYSMTQQPQLAWASDIPVFVAEFSPASFSPKSAPPTQPQATSQSEDLVIAAESNPDAEASSSTKLTQPPEDVSSVTASPNRTFEEPGAAENGAPDSPLLSARPEEQATPGSRAPNMRKAKQVPFEMLLETVLPVERGSVSFDNFFEEAYPKFSK